VHERPCGSLTIVTPVTLQVDTRVRSMLRQRDDAIAALEAKVEEAESRRRFAEDLLAKQRQELLSMSG
jgi:hypothetical protein